MTPPPYVIEWARLKGPAKILALARSRFEAGRLGQRARLELELSAPERAEVGRMLDAAWARSGAPVPVAQLRSSLLGHGTSLEEVLEEVSGPLRDLRAERNQQRESRATDEAEAMALLVDLAGQDMDPRALRRCLVGAGVWSERAAQIVRVVRYAEASVQAGSGTMRLAVLAASLFSDAHALDRDSGLGRAVARFLHTREGEGEPSVDPVGDAAAWHAAWESCGVTCDGVSARVLVLNLPLTGPGSAATLAAVAGEPVWLTLRSLRQPFALAHGVNEVFVCENPAIVEAAADRYGAASRPLVCTFGNPDLAATTLLDALSGHTRLRVRADGDRVGWQIVERLLGLPGSSTWRMPTGFDKYEEEILEELLEDLTL